MGDFIDVRRDFLSKQLVNIESKLFCLSLQKDSLIGQRAAILNQLEVIKPVRVPIKPEREKK